MEDNKMLATEEVAENVDTTTEEKVEQVEAPKLYSEEELQERIDSAVAKRLSRNEAKIRKEYDRKYGRLENVLRAGTGKESVEEMTTSFKDFYESKGIHIPEEPVYSDRDIGLLARAEAEDIIKAGLEDVVEEVDRLAGIGIEHMDTREKEIFRVLAEHRRSAEQHKELEKIGVTEDVYTSKEFREFAGKFNSDTPITEIYGIYRNTTKPNKQIKTMGSMKATPTDETGVKDFYSYEEASKFTVKDFDKNPALYEAVKKSMLKW